MALILVPLSVILLALILYQKTKGKRISLVMSFILHGIIVTVLSEGLSLFHQISYRTITFSWIILVCIFLFLVVKTKVSLKLTRILKFLRTLKTNLVLTLVILPIIIILGVISVVSPPNNNDAVVYHLPRVMHWIQNGSVDHYPAQVLRQLHLNPWAEYAIMHSVLLSGSDRYTNLVQWSGMVISLILTTLLTDLFYADKRIRLLAVVFALTLPMGILQSTSTQNDYVASMWILSSVYFILLFIRKPSLLNAGNNILYSGGSIGLALLTKGTSYFYLFPFIAWFFLVIFRRYRLKKVLSLVLIGVFALLLNAGFYLRNQNLYGSPLGPGRDGPREDFSYLNLAYSPQLLISNLIRNTSLHMGTPIPEINNWTLKVISGFHKLIRTEINHPKTTWGGGKDKSSLFKIMKTSNHEDYAGNPIHMLLFVLSIMIFLIGRKHQGDRSLILYLVALLSSYFLFTSLLRFQIWNSRLHLPIFVLMAPFIAYVMATRFKPGFGTMIMMLLLASSLPWILLNWSKPAIAIPSFVRTKYPDIVSDEVFNQGRTIWNTDRRLQYYVTAPQFEIPYHEMANLIKNSYCRNIGLKLPEEYLFWQEIKGIQNLNVQNILVKNISQSLDDTKNFAPCALITSSSQDAEIKNNRGLFAKVYGMNNFSVFVIKGIITN